MMISMPGAGTMPKEKWSENIGAICNISPSTKPSDPCCNCIQSNPEPCACCTRSCRCQELLLCLQGRCVSSVMSVGLFDGNETAEWCTSRLRKKMVVVTVCLGIDSLIQIYRTAVWIVHRPCAARYAVGKQCPSARGQEGPAEGRPEASRTRLHRSKRWVLRCGHDNRMAACAGLG